MGNRGVAIGVLSGDRTPTLIWLIWLLGLHSANKNSGLLLFFHCC
jgi:hypothetical protein